MHSKSLAGQNRGASLHALPWTPRSHIYGDAFGSTEGSWKDEAGTEEEKQNTAGLAKHFTQT